MRGEATSTDPPRQAALLRPGGGPNRAQSGERIIRPPTEVVDLLLERHRLREVAQGEEAICARSAPEIHVVEAFGLNLGTPVRV